MNSVLARARNSRHAADFATTSSHLIGFAGLAPKCFNDRMSRSARSFEIIQWGGKHMPDFVQSFFEARRGDTGAPRQKDVRSQYQRDRGRIIHSAAFRRLQGKTQVMGVGEGDFHRTRLTHSIECAQLGDGLLEQLRHAADAIPSSLVPWMPDRDLIEAACFAHDLGHPPFGHGGEKALHALMHQHGGFEGNGQTLRIIARLEKYRVRGSGIDPTRRLVLAVLKYPVPYSHFPPQDHAVDPPKCFFDEETEIVQWAFEGCTTDELALLKMLDDGKPKYRTFDSSLMELADDIAYGVHDIEDIVARNSVDRDKLVAGITSAFKEVGGALKTGDDTIAPEEICSGLYKDSYERKQTISRLVNLFVTKVQVEPVEGFVHPLLAYRVRLPTMHALVLKRMRKLSLNLVVGEAHVRQLELRGQKIVGEIYNVLKSTPDQLIPIQSWQDADSTASIERRVCDYVAGMTDSYAEKIYRRLFIPGYGSSGDEL